MARQGMCRFILPRSTLLFLALAVQAAAAADPPRAWPADPFAPLTPDRIATLPAPEQALWQMYWDRSRNLTAKSPAVVVPDFSPLTPQPVRSRPALYFKGLRLDAPAAWYTNAEARTIADRVLDWQTVPGGWTKGIDYTQPRPATNNAADLWSNGTFDNEATTAEMRFLALMITANPGAPHTAAWRKSFLRGLDYIFAAQYPNGGFPQVYPLVGGYHDGVTFNDGVMLRLLTMLRDVAAGKSEYAFVPPVLGEQAQRRLDLGIRCVLAAQLKGADGRRTIWALQYDALTLRPCAARNFEPAAATAWESAELAKFLMSLPDPSPELVAAVDDAMAWFRRTAISNITWGRFTNNAQVVASPGAPPLWARLYELNTDKPIFGDRDRTIHYAVGEVSDERRIGYTWYGTWPAGALEMYASWRREKGTTDRNP
jgi:PelA/Pel-15E family pectate lyase